MQFALRAFPRRAGRAPQFLFRLSLVATVSIIAGCQSAEPFRLVSNHMDALLPPNDTSGPGAGGNGGSATGGAGGDPGSGAGGSFYGSGGTGGGATGGSINPGSGGAGGTVDAGAALDGAGGSGGGATTDAAVEVAADIGPRDLPSEANPYCQNARWTVKASVTSTDDKRPSNGIDGNLTTRWANARFQDGTDWYQVDFGGTLRLDTITLDNTQTYPADAPGAYAVYGSSDGTTFSGPFASGNGTEGKTTIRFPAQTVRAIRINQVGTSRSPYWWQIGELQIHCL